METQISSRHINIAGVIHKDEVPSIVEVTNIYVYIKQLRENIKNGKESRRVV